MILTLILVAVAFYPTFQDAFPEVHATSVHLSLVANAAGWNYSQPSGTNPTITVLETDYANISFTAGDTQQHQFYVDVDKNGAMDCLGGDVCTGVFNWTTPFFRRWAPGIVPVGTYHYYDNLHQATTNGTIIVQPGPYPATAKINLIASTNGWNSSQPSGSNPTITIRWVQNVLINYTSLDPPGVYHQFYIDIDKNSVPDCSGQDYCGPRYDSTSITRSYWGGSWTSLPPGNYRYYDINYPAVSNGTFIILAPTPDYYISSSPNTLTIPQGGSQTSTITVSSFNNYTGTVSLTASGPGVTATINPPSVTPAKNGLATSRLNLTASTSLSPGNYQVAVTASNGTTQRSTTVNVDVIAPDFSITTNANTLNILQGSSSTATITIWSQNGFSGRVTLKDQITPSSPTASQNPSGVSIPSGGRQTSNLTVSTSPTTPIGAYTITVTGNSTGTNGPLTHSITITLSVTPPPAPPSSNPLLTTLLFEILAAIILSISVIVILAIHRSRKRQA